VADFVLDEFLPYQLAVLANRISDAFSKRYREKFGITVPEWRVVAHLSQAEKVSIREIYKQVEMDKSKASRAAARLVEAGYVTKKTNPGDRRLVELSLTRKGRDMMAEIGPLGAQFETEVLHCLPEGDRERFLTAVKTLLEKCT
jgi:DNA-binding MarR family transcriptional regulator